ncbi:TetR/AcrR family transcriptional regulator OS=Streptomyces tendae OX=1932 GN=GUR47_17475 PE=4 SV=1 [Streptomyces tendae]
MPIRGPDACLRAERDADRIRAAADTFAAASLLLGACAQRAFTHDAAPDGDRPPADAIARRLVGTLPAAISVADGTS